MFLVAGEEQSERIESGLDQPASAKWAGAPVSTLSHHQQPCCEAAIEWLRSMDFAQLSGSEPLSGPRWLRGKYEWGPCRWPLHWCEAIERETLDCGAHAAFAHSLFQARGVECFRAQLVQRYNDEAICQWRAIWDADGASADWLGDKLIYHEANAISIGSGELKLWDGSAGCWITPVQTGGYGSLASIRLISNQGWRRSRRLKWGNHNIMLNAWTELTDVRPRQIPRSF